MINSEFWCLHLGVAQAALKEIETAAHKVKDIKAGQADDAERAGLPIRKHGNVALVSTVGPMIKEAGFMSMFGIAGTRETQHALQAAAFDDDVDAIVWVMDTPGGSVEGLYELAQTVKDVNAIKPITVQVDGLLASAGYYVASYASAIYAAHDDLIGSIGTRTFLVDSSKAAEMAGFKVIPVDTGEHKSAGLPGTPVTESQIDATQQIVDGLFASFRDVVMSGRNMTSEQFDAVSDGRIFLSDAALRNGLIDGEQTLASTMQQVMSSVAPQGRSTRYARARLASQKI